MRRYAPSLANRCTAACSGCLMLPIASCNNSTGALARCGCVRKVPRFAALCIEHVHELNVIGL